MDKKAVLFCMFMRAVIADDPMDDLANRCDVDGKFLSPSEVKWAEGQSDNVMKILEDAFEELDKLDV